MANVTRTTSRFDSRTEQIETNCNGFFFINQGTIDAYVTLESGYPIVIKPQTVFGFENADERSVERTKIDLIDFASGTGTKELLMVRKYVE